MIKVDYKKIAENLVKSSMKIKEGEVVLIECGAHNLHLAEDVAVEVRKVGAFPLIEVQSDRLKKAILDEVSDEFLNKPLESLAKVHSHIDAFISLETSQDPRILNEVAAYKKAAVRNAFQPVRDAWRKNKVRGCLFLYPSAEMAESYGVSYEYYHDRVWGATMMSTQELFDAGKPVKDFLTGADKIQITSPKGTDLRFSIKDRGILICSNEDLPENNETCGYWLNIPAGEVFTSIIEDSAEGVAVFDRVFVDGKLVENLALTFKGGSVVSFKAETGEKIFADYYEFLNPKDKIAAEFGIGTNPYIKGVIGCLHTDEKIAGTIHIAIGNSAIYGGKNETPVHFDMIMNNPTVNVDGRLMMKEGIMSENIPANR